MEETIGVLSNESQVPLLMPPPRFADKLNVVTKHADPRYYVAIQIFESKVVSHSFSFLVFWLL
jgi:vacuolar protein sorting-associated protein 13A/C